MPRSPGSRKRALVDHVTPMARSRADHDPHRRDHLLAKEVATIGGPAAAQVRSNAGCPVNARESPWVTLLRARGGHGSGSWLHHMIKRRDVTVCLQHRPPGIGRRRRQARSRRCLCLILSRAGSRVEPALSAEAGPCDRRRISSGAGVWLPTVLSAQPRSSGGKATRTARSPSPRTGNGAAELRITSLSPSDLGTQAPQPALGAIAVFGER
jgi:hypothetical protein